MMIRHHPHHHRQYHYQHQQDQHSKYWTYIVGPLVAVAIGEVGGLAALLPVSVPVLVVPTAKSVAETELYDESTSAVSLIVV
mmetsp:Transcript_18959/g.20918  ORF Transcript_18959/g.20918 Transcript_18959/m.20918 type:complete len:82 (-) Transcript_18959:30-275(-)